MSGLHIRTKDLQDTYLLAQIDQLIMAIPASEVIHIGQRPKLKSIPQADQAIPGVMQFRESVVSVIDLRILLGYKPMQQHIDEIHSLMMSRKQDHIDWINELEASVLEERAFQKGTDPTSCAFGKWFYSYETSDKSLEMMLKRFEYPHNQVHATAEKVLSITEEGRKEDALAMIESVRNQEMQTMIKLFDSFSEAFAESMHELVVILQIGSDRYGVTFDKVHSVQRLEPMPEEDRYSDGVTAEALKDFGNEIFLHDGNVVYELIPERLSDFITHMEDHHAAV